MSLFPLARSGIVPVTNQDLLTLIAAANRRINIMEIVAGGVGATTAAIVLGLYRSTGGTTPGAALTPGELPHTELVAPAFTNATTWSVQPTLVGDPLLVLPFRDQGGNFIWRPSDYEQQIEERNSGQLSLRPIGTAAGTVSFHIHVLER